MSKMGPERTALFVIDMQNAFCSPKGSFTRMGADMGMCIAAIPGCRQLIESARAVSVPVFYFAGDFRPDFTDGGVIFHEIVGKVSETGATVTGTWDAEIVADLAPQERDYMIYKSRFSGFYGTRLEPILSSMRIENIVFCGVTTNICVETTVRDAAQRNYRCFVARDAVGEVDPEMHKAGLRAMEYAFARIVDVDDVVQVWSGEADGAEVALPSEGSPEFARGRQGVAVSD